MKRRFVTVHTGTLTERVYAAVQQAPAGISVRAVAADLLVSPKAVANPLYRLFWSGRIDRWQRGIYAPRRKAA